MKQKRYLAKDGERDWIDKCANYLPTEAFNGAMFFNIGKYYQRLGKKDLEEQELEKIEDYRQRWKQKLIEFGEHETSVDWFVDKKIEQAKQLAQE